MPRKKRKSYMQELQADLDIAKDAQLHPSIIADIEARLERHRQYKHEWYKARYVPKALRKAVP